MCLERVYGPPWGRASLDPRSRRGWPPASGGGRQRLGSFGQGRLAREQRAERRRLEQMALAARGELELGEDGGRVRVALGLVQLELGHEPGPQLLVAVVGVEDALDDELRRGRPVAGVLLRAEGD